MVPNQALRDGVYQDMERQAKRQQNQKDQEYQIALRKKLEEQELEANQIKH